MLQPSSLREAAKMTGDERRSKAAIVPGRTFREMGAELAHEWAGTFSTPRLLEQSCWRSR